jgi:hypothetical protein
VCERKCIDEREERCVAFLIGHGVGTYGRYIPGEQHSQKRPVSISQCLDVGKISFERTILPNILQSPRLYSFAICESPKGNQLGKTPWSMKHMRKELQFTRCNSQLQDIPTTPEEVRIYVQQECEGN